MDDPNMTDFQGRVGRISGMHARGGGFEAEGTLGKQAFTVRRTRVPRFLRIIPAAVLVAVVLVGLKAGFELTLGSDLYAAKVALLREGSDMDKLGAVILQPDPLSARLVDLIHRHF